MAAENDIYNSELKYNNFKANLNEFLKAPNKNNRSKYYCRNSENLKYFHKLFNLFETKDTSYVRRLRIIGDLKVITYVSSKDLTDLEREDINEIIRFINKVYSERSKADFIKHLKYIWRNLFPEKDEKGRPDNTITPYAVRHLSGKIEKSREKLKGDILSFENYEKLINYFSNDPKMQCFLALAVESLGRPQELLYCKISDVERYDNYAKIWISEHGKEGNKFLFCIDSYPYLANWLNNHPYKNDSKCYLFIGYDNRRPKSQLKPNNINARIRIALKNLDIENPTTCYSLKRMGITFKRLKGESDVEIQRAAGWTSTKQLKVYDKSNQDDVFRMQLVKKGLLKDKDNSFPYLKMETKPCLFCDYKLNKFTDDICSNCKRPLDREKIKELEIQKNEDVEKLNKEELNFVQRLDTETLPNIKFWVRNREKKDPFYIQGWYQNKFYPDFVALSNKGNIIALEWKGKDRVNNEDTQHKIEIAKEWEKLGRGKLHFFLIHVDNIEEVLKKVKEL